MDGADQEGGGGGGSLFLPLLWQPPLRQQSLRSLYDTHREQHAQYAHTHNICHTAYLSRSLSLLALTAD